VAGEHWPQAWPATIVGLLLFQTVIVTFASYLLWFWLVRHYPATQLSAFTLSTPVFGLLAGVLLMADPLTTRLVVALVGVSAGIALVHHGKRGVARPMPVSASGRDG